LIACGTIAPGFILPPICYQLHKASLSALLLVSPMTIILMRQWSFRMKQIRPPRTASLLIVSICWAPTLSSVEVGYSNPFSGFPRFLGKFRRFPVKILVLKSSFRSFPSEYATSNGNRKFWSQKWAQFDEEKIPLTAWGKRSIFFLLFLSVPQ
jgi:hypothetical protein